MELFEIILYIQLRLTNRYVVEVWVVVSSDTIIDDLLLKMAGK